MKTTQEHRSPQVVETDIRHPHPAVDHRKLVIRMVQELVQPFLAIRTFVQKHPNFDPDDLVTKWQRVLKMISRFEMSLALELGAIHGGRFGPEADPEPLPPRVPGPSKDPRIEATHFITTMTGYAEDLLTYVLENPDTFSAAGAMSKNARLFLALQRDAFPLTMVVRHLVTGRDPWDEPKGS